MPNLKPDLILSCRDKNRMKINNALIVMLARCPALKNVKILDLSYAIDIQTLNENM